jgi:hypothetical protein
MWFSYTPVLTLWLTCLHAVLIHVVVLKANRTAARATKKNVEKLVALGMHAGNLSASIMCGKVDMQLTCYECLQGKGSIMSIRKIRLLDMQVS